MNILLSLGSLSLEFNANFNIVYNLANQLKLMGHKVYLLGDANSESIKTKVVNNIEFCYIYKCKEEKTWLRFAKGKNKAGVKKYLEFAFKHPICSLFILKSSFFMGALNYKNNIEKFIKKNNIDLIVAFTLPFETAYASILNSSKIKKVYYQLDPYGLYHGEDVNTKKRTSKEIKLIKKSDMVITTAALYDEYQKDRLYQKYKHKYTAVDFPLIVAKENLSARGAFDFDDDNINILFCGKISDEYRSPEFLLNVFKKSLKNIPNMRLYFLGDVNSEVMDKEPLCQNNHIEIHGSVPIEFANSTMMSADILVNIGNNIPNMVPSKIFDYFSTGKPILNIAKIPDCPAAQYIEKHPLHLTLKEFEPFDTPRQNRFEQFVLYSKNKSLDFHSIEKIFYTATPEYAAKIILNTI